MRGEERGSEPRRNASRISQRLLTYAISFTFTVLNNFIETELFSISMNKKIGTFLNSLFQRLPDSFPSSLSFEF